MAKVFIFGGSGRIATDLIKDLVADDNIITAVARHPENIIQLDDIMAEKLDSYANVNSIAKQVKGFDTIYFTAGSRGKDLVQTDAMGAIKTMMAAEETGVKRYIMFNSMLNLDTDSWKKAPNLEDYLTTKFFADTYLMDFTNLEYTILQLGSLTEAVGTGKIQLGAKVTNLNPILGVAETSAATLKHPNTINKIIPVSSGETSTDDALKEI